MRTRASRCRLRRPGGKRDVLAARRSARASWRTAGAARGRRWSSSSPRASSKTGSNVEWDVRAAAAGEPQHAAARAPERRRAHAADAARRAAARACSSTSCGTGSTADSFQAGDAMRMSSVAMAIALAAFAAAPSRRTRPRNVHPPSRAGSWRRAVQDLRSVHGVPQRPADALRGGRVDWRELADVDDGQFGARSRTGRQACEGKCSIIRRRRPRSRTNARRVTCRCRGPRRI